MAAAPKKNKSEFHAELLRVNLRMRFIRAAHYSTALDKNNLEELRSLEAIRLFCLSELKNNNTPHTS